MATWSVATPPASYGEVDDGLLVRHVSVSASASLTDIKKAILKAYEDQYEPSQITLFTRKYDDEPTRVTTDRAAKLKLLSYAPDWAILAPDAAHASSVLLCEGPTWEFNPERGALEGAAPSSGPRSGPLRPP